MSTLNIKYWLLFLGDITAIMVSIKFSQWIRFGRYYDIFSVETGASFFAFMFYLAVLYIFDLYNVRRIHLSMNMVMRTAIAVGVSGVTLALLFYSLPQWQFGRGVFLIQMASSWVLFVIWRYAFSLFFLEGADQEPVLIIGAGKSGRDLFQLLNVGYSPYKVIGFLDDDAKKKDHDTKLPKILGPVSQLQTIAELKDVHLVVLAITRNRSPVLIRNILAARLNGIEVLDAPSLYEGLTGSIPVNHIHDGWLLFADGFNLISKKYIRQIKRLSDFWASILLLILAAPLMLLIAVTIKLESRGPVIFKQDRVGFNGIIFKIFKFRSMVLEAEKEGAVWALEKDPRVTHVGHVIRRLRLDELPQLLNVIRGEMSLIGPRPERPEFVNLLEKKIPYYSVRHHVRPGITGWAQVSYRYGASMEDALRKLEYDLFYIKNMSLFLDMSIVLKTIGVVIFGQGAR